MRRRNTSRITHTIIERRKPMYLISSKLQSPSHTKPYYQHFRNNPPGNSMDVSTTNGSNPGSPSVKYGQVHLSSRNHMLFDMFTALTTPKLFGFCLKHESMEQGVRF